MPGKLVGDSQRQQNAPSESSNNSQNHDNDQGDSAIGGRAATVNPKSIGSWTLIPAPQESINTAMIFKVPSEEDSRRGVQAAAEGRRILLSSLPSKVQVHDVLGLFDAKYKV